MKNYKTKIKFQSPSKNVLLHSEGVQTERLIGLLNSTQELFVHFHLDFEEPAKDLTIIKDVLIDTFGEDVVIGLLNDDTAAHWAMGFAQATILAAMINDGELDDEPT